MPLDALERVPAPRAGHFAGARDDGELPRPRRRRAGPHRPFLDLQKPDEASRLWSIAEKVHALALELGGTVSSAAWHRPGAHAVGGPAIWPALSALSAGQGDLRSEEHVQSRQDRRSRSAASRTAVTDDATAPRQPASCRSSLNWPARRACRHGGERIATAAGNAGPRRPAQRMCPIFRATQPRPRRRGPRPICCAICCRQQANGLQFGSEEVRAVADLCVNCKMCAVGVSGPCQYPEADARSQGGQRRRAWPGPQRLVFFPARKRAALGELGVSFLANLALRSRTSRWLFEKLFRLSSAERRLPRFAGTLLHGPGQAARLDAQAERQPGRSSSISSISTRTTSNRRSREATVAGLAAQWLRRVHPGRAARQRHGAAGAWRRRNRPRDRRRKICVSWSRRPAPGGRSFAPSRAPR